MTEMELERRALLGDKAAQAACTLQEVALRCQCGEKPIVLRPPANKFYRIACPKCRMNTGGCSTLTLAMAIWNNRPEPPIGRCGECANRHSSEFCECRDEQDFCSDFEPKGGETDGCRPGRT